MYKNLDIDSWCGYFLVDVYKICSASNDDELVSAYVNAVQDLSMIYSEKLARLTGLKKEEVDG